MAHSVKDYTDAILNRFETHGLRLYEVHDLAPGRYNVVFTHPLGSIMMPFSSRDTSIFTLHLFLPQTVKNASAPDTYLKMLRMVNALNVISLNVRFVVDQAEAGPVALPGPDWLWPHLLTVASGRPPVSHFVRIAATYSAELLRDVAAEDWCAAFDAALGAFVNHVYFLKVTATALDIELVDP